ncbi:hypothetical protein BV20DRAFT_566073 [Pilatotrama ljubarskyi]|nr:hypothetical protein BV20DRAFT_566073 [Pilatotrama ljubarskyi]
MSRTSPRTRGAFGFLTHAAFRQRVPLAPRQKARFSSHHASCEKPYCKRLSSCEGNAIGHRQPARPQARAIQCTPGLSLAFTGGIMYVTTYGRQDFLPCGEDRSQPSRVCTASESASRLLMPDSRVRTPWPGPPCPPRYGISIAADWAPILLRGSSYVRWCRVALKAALQAPPPRQQL